jgi:hypothetical protein
VSVVEFDDEETLAEKIVNDGVVAICADSRGGEVFEIDNDGQWIG